MTRPPTSEVARTMDRLFDRSSIYKLFMNKDVVKFAYANFWTLEKKIEF